MKMKFMTLLLMVLMVISVAQPIFAAPQRGDTKIASAHDETFNDMTVKAGEDIEIRVRLLEYFDDNPIAPWYFRPFRYLLFYVYEPKADGTKGDLTNEYLVYSAGAWTGLLTGIATPPEFKLRRKGNYTLLVKYEGDLKHCNGTANINVI